MYVFPLPCDNIAVSSWECCVKLISFDSNDILYTSEQSSAAFHIFPADNVSEDYKDEKYAKNMRGNSINFTKLRACFVVA